MSLTDNEPFLPDALTSFEINVFVQGIPKGQPRPRAFSMGGKARMYDPGTAEAWKGAIAAAIGTPAAPMLGPVDVTIFHSMPRPKGHFHTGKRAGELRANAPKYHTGKPDIDNLTKAALDALTQIGLWRDDSQVFQLQVEKVYGYPTGARIIISENPNQKED